MSLAPRYSLLELIGILSAHWAGFHVAVLLPFGVVTSTGLILIVATSLGERLYSWGRCGREGIIGVTMLADRQVLHTRSGDRQVYLKRIVYLSAVLVVLDFSVPSPAGGSWWRQPLTGRRRLTLLPDSLPLSDRKALVAWLRYSIAPDARITSPSGR